MFRSTAQKAAPQTPVKMRIRKGLWEDGEWKCNCSPRIPAARRTVRKDGPNQGRIFYNCARTSCNLFLWEEDALIRQNQEERTPTKPPRTPSGYSPHRIPYRPQLSTPLTTPSSKRRAEWDPSDVFTTDPSTPSSKAARFSGLQKSPVKRMSRVLPPPVEGELRYPTLPRLLSEREDEVEEAEYREEPKDVESQVTQDGLDTEEDDDDIFVSPPTMKRRAGGLFGRLRDAREGRGNAAAVVVVRKYDDEPATAETSFMTDVSYTTALTSQRNGTSFTALAPSSPVRAAPSSPIRPTVSASFSMPSPGGFPFSSRKPTRAVIGEVFDALREHGIVIPTYTAESKLREILTIHADRAEGFRRGRDLVRTKLAQREAEVKELLRQVERLEKEKTEARLQIEKAEKEKEIARVEGEKLRKDIAELNLKFTDWKINPSQVC